VGPAGAAALAPSSSCLVIVDVLSFSTSVTVAAETGMRVYPWGDPATAAELAREIDSCSPVPILADGAFTAAGGQ
jgi:2-phosphosulfolactate phosphatase